MTWGVAASVWARIEPVSFLVKEEAAFERGTISHRIWVRFREDIAAGQRFRKGTRVFLVRLVRDPDETRRYLVCQCEEEARWLLAAIHRRLADDAALNAIIGADGVRDRLLPRPKLLCILFGEMETRDYSTSTEIGEEHFLTLEIWSDGEGRREAQEIAGLVHDLLHDAALVLDGAVLVSLLRVSTRTRSEPKTKAYLVECGSRR